MDPVEARKFAASDEFRAIVSRHNRFAWGWTVLILGLYLGFDIICMVLPALVSDPIDSHGALTFGVIIAFVISLACVVIAFLTAWRSAEG